MTSFRKICLINLIVLFAGLGLATEAKADAVSLTLTPTTIVSNGSFTLSGFFTNSGNLTFQPNRFTVFFSPDFGVPYGIVTNTIGGQSPLDRPVPAMSSTAVLPLLDFSFFTQQPPQGTYNGTLSVSGFDSSGVAMTTAPVQFTVEVPVPEPATIALLSTGLLTAVAASRRRRRSAEKK